MLPALFAFELTVTAYPNHAILGDNCDRAFEVRSGTARMIYPGYRYRKQGRISEND